MQVEIVDIKNKVLNKIVKFAIYFAIPSVILSIADFFFNERQLMHISQTIYTIIIVIIYIKRNQLRFDIKLHLLSVSFLIIGISSMYVYNFSGIFYACFVPVLISGILLGRRTAFIYLIIVGILYFIIAAGYSTNIIGEKFNHELQIHDPLTWIVFFIGTAFILSIIVIASSELYKQFINSIEEKIRVTQDLTDYKNQLEHIVKERTEELETTNEEIRATNEELYAKNEKIEEQNNELETTLNHLREAQSQLVESEKMASLGVLTAGVAHEINNPLNFISGSVSGLEEYFNTHLSDHVEEVTPFMNGLKVGIERTSAIISGLNQFSRKNESHNEDCDIHAIIDNCIVMLHNKIKYKGTVKTKYTDKKYKLTGNIGKLHQVILNLINNAIHAIDNNGEIIVVTKAENNIISIEISDNGYGIPKENISKITEPFFTTKEPGQGTGLGLSIAYKIVNEHNGTLKFKSEEGEGTIVSVQLPMQT